jgi:hypothetical protein
VRFQNLCGEGLGLLSILQHRGERFLRRCEWAGPWPERVIERVRGLARPLASGTGREFHLI